MSDPAFQLGMIFGLIIGLVFRILPIIFIVWLAVRFLRRSQNKENKVKCANCGTLNPDSAVFCNSCGKDLYIERSRSARA
jgi:uncharacterized paraquat-inducible protein A